MKMEPIVSSETSAIRTQMPGNYPKRNKLRLEHGESLKTRLIHLYGEETTRHIRLFEILHSPAYEDGTDSEFRNFGN